MVQADTISRGSTGNVMWGLAANAMKLCGAVIVLPVILCLVPSDRVGVWYVFVAMGILAGLADMGFSISATRTVSYAIAGARKILPEGQSEESGPNIGPNIELLKMLAGTLRYYYQFIAISLFIVMSAAGMCFIGFSDRTNAGLELQLCWGIFIAGSCIALTSNVWLALLQGINRVKEVYQVQAFGSLCNYAIALAGVAMGFELWALVFGYAAMAVVQQQAGRILFLRTSGIRASEIPRRVDRNILRTIWPVAWRTGVGAIGNYMVVQANVIICSAFLTLEQTASYGFSLQAAWTLANAASLLVLVNIPVINQLRQLGKEKDIAVLFTSRVRLFLLAYITGSALLILAGTPVMKYFQAKTLLLPTIPLFLMLMIIGLEMHHSLYGNLVITDNCNPFVVPAVLSGALIVTLSILTVPDFGLFGLLLSQGLVQASFNNWWVVFKGIHGLGMTTFEYAMLFMKPRQATAMDH